MSAAALARLAAEIADCRRCPRLVDWREQVAREKRAAFRDGTYWGRPLPGFGDPQARVVLLGLAPAAHGANRTGRMFTGDRSGDFLYAALHATGFANQPTAVQPRRRSRAARLLHHRRRALRAAGEQAAARRARQLPPVARGRARAAAPCPRARLPRRLRLEPRRAAAAAEVRARRRGECEARRYTLLGCFHPSQQNTFTGRLTPPMIEAVLRRARALAGG